MIQKIDAKNRHYEDMGWLQTHWLFSFSDYHDPNNIHWGPLRVFNDDIVKPGDGFPTHPHHEMEIVTIVLKGEITHKDSMGTETVVKANEVQRMTAGTGLQHSEFNHGTEDLHLFQIWIFPGQKGLEPSHEERSFSPELWKNKLAPLVSGQGLDNVVKFHTDSTIYRAALDKGMELNFASNENRKTFIYVTTGSITINGNKFDARDQARISSETAINIKAESDADFILIDLPSHLPQYYE